MRALIGFSLLSLSVGANAAEPLKPSSKWVVAYENSQCVATRNYGTADDPLFLAFRPSPLGGVMRIATLRKARMVEPEESNAIVQFGTERALSAPALRYSDKTSKLRLTTVTVDMAEMKARQSAATVRVNADGRSETFALSSVPQVLKQLDACLVGLREHWHISEASAPPTLQMTGIKSLPKEKAPISAYFSPDDYPTKSADTDKQGSVTVLMLVDEQGKVADCSVEQSAGAAGLDAMSCFKMQQKALFVPAVGMDGKPARGAVTQRITWRLMG